MLKKSLDMLYPIHIRSVNVGKLFHILNDTQILIFKN